MQGSADLSQETWNQKLMSGMVVLTQVLPPIFLRIKKSWKRFHKAWEVSFQKVTYSWEGRTEHVF